MSRHKKKHKKYQVRPISNAKYMGIDWGRSDVGIALSDGESRIAFAYTTLENTKGKKLIDQIGTIIQEKGVEVVVIGIPSPINREEVFYVGEKLGELLEHNYGVVIGYQNEMFSTKLAQTKLIEKGIRGIERFDDQEAARIILQDWLDRETIANAKKKSQANDG